MTDRQSNRKTDSERAKRQRQINERQTDAVTDIVIEAVTRKETE